MKSLKLVCHVSLMLSIIPAAYAHSVHHAPTTSGVAQILQGLYNQSDAAMARKDLVGAYRSCSPNMVVTDTNGHDNDLNTIRQRLTSILSVAQSISGRTRITRVSQQGSQATVLTTSLNQIVIKNQNTGRTRTLADHMSSKDVWSNASGRWLVMRSQVLSEKATLDGRPITAPTR